MITENFIRIMVNTILQIIGSLINTALDAVPNPMPDYQFQVPEPFWFIVAFILANVALIYPLVLAWWAWRQVKA